MSPLKPMIIGLLMLTTALAGCVDGDNHPDHHDDEPGLCLLYTSDAADEE